MAQLERVIGTVLRNFHAGDSGLLNREEGISHAPELVLLESPAFDDEGWIPDHYTAIGENILPPLAWSGVPHGAREIVIVIEDPDAPMLKPIVHCLITGINPTENRIEEGDGGQVHRFGENTRGETKYMGPRPVLGHGPHRYVFQIFALDRSLERKDRPLRKKDLVEPMRDHVLARGCLIGRFERV